VSGQWAGGAANRAWGRPGSRARNVPGDEARGLRLFAHLVYGTPRENNLDTVRQGKHVNAAKTHCPASHLYDEANTYLQGPGLRNRVCRTCERERGQRRRGVNVDA
jgi:hypothetical protein